jgi:hypothetical protein
MPRGRFARFGVSPKRAARHYLPMTPTIVSAVKILFTIHWVIFAHR